jgi:hypothetical protein
MTIPATPGAVRVDVHHVLIQPLVDLGFDGREHLMPSGDTPNRKVQKWSCQSFPRTHHAPSSVATAGCLRRRWPLFPTFALGTSMAWMLSPAANAPLLLPGPAGCRLRHGLGAWKHGRHPGTPMKSHPKVALLALI